MKCMLRGSVKIGKEAKAADRAFARRDGSEKRPKTQDSRGRFVLGVAEHVIQRTSPSYDAVLEEQ